MNGSSGDTADCKTDTSLGIETTSGRGTAPSLTHGSISSSVSPMSLSEPNTPSNTPRNTGPNFLEEPTGMFGDVDAWPDKFMVGLTKLDMSMGEGLRRMEAFCLEIVREESERLRVELEGQRNALDAVQREIGARNDLEAVLCGLRQDLNNAQSSLIDIRNSEAQWRQQAQQDVEASQSHVLRANEAIKGLIINLSTLNAEVKPALVQMASAEGQVMDLLCEMGSLRERQDCQSEALRNEIARWQASDESRQGDVAKRLRDTEKLVRQMQDEQQARTVALETWMSKLSKPRNDKRGSVAELEEEKNRWASWALVSAELQQRLDKVEKRSSEVPDLSARIDTIEDLVNKLSSCNHIADDEHLNSSAVVGEPGPAKPESRRRSEDVGRDIEDLRSHLTCTLDEIRNEMVDVRKGLTQEQKKRRDLTWEVERLAEEVGTAVSQSMLEPFDLPSGDVRWKQVSEPTCATPSQSLDLDEGRCTDAENRSFEMTVTPGIYSFSGNAEVDMRTQRVYIAGEDAAAPDGTNISLRNLQNAISRFNDVLGGSSPTQKRAKHPTMSWETSSRSPRRSAAQASQAPLPKARWSSRQFQSRGRAWACNVGAVHHQG